MSRVGVKVHLSSGRTLGQGVSLETGKLAPEYTGAVAICEMSAVDLEVLGINDGDTVQVEALFGSTIVRAKLDRRAEPGAAFIPCGPYFNILLGTDTQESGMPQFKTIEAHVFSAKGQPIPSLEEILENMRHE